MRTAEARRWLDELGPSSDLSELDRLEAAADEAFLSRHLDFARELYERVQATIEQGDDSLLDAEQDIEDFLAYHPTDSRTREFEALLKEIDIRRLERQGHAEHHECQEDDAGEESLKHGESPR